jgi:hypothetical protein
MTRILLRAAFVSLLLLTVAIQTQGPVDSDREKLASNVLEVLAAKGLDARVAPPPARDILPVAAQFQAPGCSDHIEVVLFHINLQEAPLFDAVLKPNYVRLFAYLDETWLTENRMGMRLTWLKHRVRSVLGLSRFIRSKDGLLIVSPPGCQIAQTVDWSLVWDRRTMTPAKVAQ